MDDLISRQAAIATAISGRVRTLPTTEDGENWIRVNEVRDSLLSLPSAQPETGKWIKLYAGNYKCSVCGVWFANDDNEMVEDFKYCPNCGCKMEVEVEE